jgi:ferritin-like metal-binding protein YciE
MDRQKASPLPVTIARQSAQEAEAMTRLLENLEDLYFDELRDLTDAGEQKARALEQMAAVARSNDVRSRLIKESGLTQMQVSRMREVFGPAKQQSRAHHARGIEGLLRGGLDLAAMMAEPRVKDIGMLIAANNAQQYELAGFGTACTLAEILGREEEAQLLRRIATQKKHSERDLAQALRSLSPAPPNPET